MTVTFKNQAAQGDLLLRRIKKLPEDLVERKAEGGKHVLAHSETGHDHWINEHEAKVFDTADRNPLICYLQLAGNTTLEHARPFDTHQSISISPGVYEVRRQREYTPQGWRRVED